MLFRVKGYIDGRETFLYRDDLIRCHFCDKFVTPINFMWQKLQGQIEQFQELLGQVPDGAVGKIGNKIICKSCIGDLENLLPSKYDYDD